MPHATLPFRLGAERRAAQLQQFRARAEIAWFGFDPKLADNTPAALTAVALVFSLGPAIGHVIGALLVRGFALDEARQAEIRRALAAESSSTAGQACARR